MIILKKVIVIFSIFVLVGCYPIEQDDVSNSEKYSHLLGKRFITTEDLLIHTIRGNHSVYKYVVTPFPGFGGPEVSKRKTLPKGTVFSIKKVLSCSNCFLFENTDFIINIDSLIYKKLASLGSMPSISIEENGKVYLDPRFFKNKEIKIKGDGTL